MGFQVVYVAGGELEKVKKKKKIKNFAQLNQPYNKMVMMNVPAIAGTYDLEYTSPDEDMELLSIVVTCSGYGENDYYNLWVNDELWFDTWFPTEVKEGLYIGTSTYVYEIPANTPFKLTFVNISGTAKKVWLGVRYLRNAEKVETKTVELIDTLAMTPPSGEITYEHMQNVIKEANSSGFLTL